MVFRLHKNIDTLSSSHVVVSDVKIEDYCRSLLVWLLLFEDEFVCFDNGRSGLPTVGPNVLVSARTAPLPLLCFHTTTTSSIDHHG